jgi:hypothetical protein
MTTKIGFARGTCPVCGRLIVRKRPVDNTVCDCYRFCPICDPPYTVPMTTFKPDLTSSTYRNEKAHDVKGGGAEPPEWTIETLFVCYNHSPPHYSKQKPVEVRLQ